MSNPPNQNRSGDSLYGNPFYLETKNGERYLAKSRYSNFLLSYRWATEQSIYPMGFKTREEAHFHLNSCEFQGLVIANFNGFKEKYDNAKVVYEEDVLS